MGKVRRLHRSTIARLAAGWALVVLLVLGWQMLAYRGAMARLAEWQFRHWGGSLPVLTLVLLAALVGLPPLLAIRYGLRRSVRAEPAAVAAEIRRYARRFLFLLCAATLGLAGAALIALAPLARPGEKGPAVTIAAGDPTEGVREGPVRLIGRVDAARTATYREDLLWTRRERRFAPVLPPAGEATTLRYFIELGRAGNDEAGPSHLGILRRDALPGELVELYRGAGFAVPPTYYVLSDREAIRWPSLRAAARLGTAAAVFALFALLQWWRYRRLRAPLAGEC